MSDAPEDDNISKDNIPQGGKYSRWRGQALLDLDIRAEDDDTAMEAIEQHISPILGRGCSIAERRVVLRQFFGHAAAPWQKQIMTQNGMQLIDRAVELAEVTQDGDWPDATKPDLHIHRQLLEESIDHALRRNYRDGMSAGRRQYRPDLDQAIQDAESPPNIATLLRKFASGYDERGWAGEANLLRDAATQVEDLPQDQKEPA